MYGYMQRVSNRDLLFNTTNPDSSYNINLQLISCLCGYKGFGVGPKHYLIILLTY
jgi:hypothetical protein